MTVRIVTDSTCDLPDEIINQYKISINPCYINFQERSYLDVVELGRSEFYQRISDLNDFPKTSAPSVGSFLEIYNRLAREGAEEIISIHIRAGLSNMSNVVRLAAESCREVRVRVIEVGQVAITLGFLVMTAARAVSEGKSVQDVTQLIKELDQRSYLFAALGTLEFLKHSGRVSSMLVDLASLLKIKPVILLRLGGISLVDRIRTSSKQIEVLIKLAQQQSPLEWIGVAHTNAAEKAAQLAASLKIQFHFEKEIWIEEATPVLGVHAGPDALAVACVKASAE
jgi:DegV family protein with EDD domain